MHTTDTIYGSFDIGEAVLHDLIVSPEVQRLKGVWQHGMPPRYIPSVTHTFTRYEHSIGVMLLLRVLGASLEEQIAGLLHDVSHLAFSHLYDWVVAEELLSGDRHTSGQDARHNDYLIQSSLPSILSSHGYSLQTFLDYKQFTLLEQETPELCADRVDYCLREMEADEAKGYVSALKAQDRKIVFADKDSALGFAQYFLSRNRDFWASYDLGSRYMILKNVLRYAIKKDVVKLSDFYGGDEDIMRKVEQMSDTFVIHNLRLLRNVRIPNTDHGVPVKLKLRYVDPLFIEDGHLQRLARVDVAFAREVEDERATLMKPILVHDVV